MQSTDINTEADRPKDALTPQQMRDLADEVRRELTGVILAAENEYGFDPSHPEQALLDVSVAALRTAADQLDAVPTREQVLDAITYGNPYSTCDFEEEIADRIMAILTADTAPQVSVQYNGHNGLAVFADATRRLNEGKR